LSGREAEILLSAAPSSSFGKVPGIHLLSALPNIRETVQRDTGDVRHPAQQGETETVTAPRILNKVGKGQHKRLFSPECFSFSSIVLVKNAFPVVSVCFLGLTEYAGAGCVRCVEQQHEEAAHHPDCSLAGGVPVHVGLCRPFAALPPDGTGYTASPIQVWLKSYPL